MAISLLKLRTLIPLVSSLMSFFFSYVVAPTYSSNIVTADKWIFILSSRLYKLYSIYL